MDPPPGPCSGLVQVATPPKQSVHLGVLSSRFDRFQRLPIIATETQLLSVQLRESLATSRVSAESTGGVGADV